MDAPAWQFDAPIETERLILRPHRLADLDDLFAFHSDPDVVRYLPWPVRDRDATLLHLEGRIGMARAAKDGDWLVLAVEERATSAVVGEILLKRENAAEGVAELGFAFARRVHGMGIAREAADALLDAGLERFGIRRLVATVVEGNDDSTRLLGRLGFERDASVPVGPDGLMHYVR